MAETVAKGIAKLREEMQQPHVVTRRLKYRSRLEGERYIDPGTGELVTFEHMLDRWRDYKFLRDGRHIRLATPEEIEAAGKAVTVSVSGKAANKGGKS